MRSDHRLLGGVAMIVAATLIGAVAMGFAGATMLAVLVIVAMGQAGALAWVAYSSKAVGRSAHTQWVGLDPRTRAHGLAAQLRDVRNAVDALPDAVVLLDNAGRTQWFNGAGSKLLGLQQSSVGQPLAQQLVDSELGAWLQTNPRQPATDMPAPSNSALRLGATMLPFGSDQSLLLARDISTLSRLEQVRRDFVANVSHELRTPLTVIHGYLELLDPEDVPELAPVLREMRLQSRRMGQIVEDLLTLSRLETRDALPDEEVAMSPLIEMLRREAEALSQGQHVITVDVQSAANLRGSPHDLHSAFSNLVSNAVRYTPRGGAIAIGWRQNPDGGATFSVRDSGLGISAEHLNRLTERFYRISSSRSRESGGTGLGLSIVKHVLSLHQAQLIVESEPGAGSTFSSVLDASRVLPPKRDNAESLTE